MEQCRHSQRPTVFVLSLFLLVGIGVPLSNGVTAEIGEGTPAPALTTLPVLVGHSGEPFHEAAGHAAHLGACEDDPPVLTTALSRAMWVGLNSVISSPSLEAHPAVMLGGWRLQTAVDFLIFLTGAFPFRNTPAKLYTLHCTYLI